MGLEMTGWLSGKTVCMIGEDDALAAALRDAGADVVGEGDSDCLVHVARATQALPIHEIDHADWRAALADGLDGRFEAAKLFNEAMRAGGRGGTILFVGSPEQQAGADQAAASGALGNLTKTLAVEWARDGIRVNSILTNDRGTAMANLATYLLSDYAAYVTGIVTGITLEDDFLR